MRKIVALCTILILPAMLIFGPGAAEAVPAGQVIQPYLGTPVTAGQALGAGLSDLLQVTWNGSVGWMLITEGGGEQVSTDLIFPILGTTNPFPTGWHNTIYLVEPGANVVNNGDGTVTGYRSDFINANISSDSINDTLTDTIHFNINSDQDPGTHDVVTGFLENGTMRDITAALFNGQGTGTNSVTVLAASDVEVSVPEPATMLLLGFGMVGLAGVRRFKK